ncbi:hypothetical protein [Bradyrhizobium zhanjiangense]|uniref:Uncharacterized protein n=1 Tax=Bradyrhizobium zhanjiangense TaxID=1325107 RepID=A0A4Q0QP86_9BRAD|nr:hypothetical protein [Bradyrhizobium zhanjiangense]RXG97364.1 hypothetical protein EAS61_15325 [Bradyrhizobium zhanjiangense]
MKRYFPAVLLAGLLVVALQPVYFLLMSNLDRVISHNGTWAHIRNAFDSGVLETSFHSKNFWITGGDRFTDCYSLGIGLQPGVEAAAAGITASRPVSDGHSCDDLKAAAADPISVTWYRYSRYWHGYRVYSAPVASALPILALKLLDLLLLATAAIFFCLEAAKLIGVSPTLGLCLPVLFMSDFVRIWQVTPHAVSTAVILGGAAVFAAAIRKRAPDLVLIVVAAAAGSLFNFVDFLVNPPWMPMLLAFFLLAAGRGAPITLVCVGVWFSAYGATWAAKWVGAYLVEPSFDIKSDVIGTALFRISGDNVKVWHFPLAATVKVFTNAFLSWGMLILLPALIFFRVPLRRPRFALAWPALIPVVWFEILSNHSQIHSFFVSRSAAAAIGVTAASALIAANVTDVGAMFAAARGSQEDLRTQEVQ